MKTSRILSATAAGLLLAACSESATGPLAPASSGGILRNNAPAVTGAAFTTVNEAVDGAGHCKNGNPNNNCNIYDGKEFVWLNGGPSTAYVGDGQYFFAVLSPGGQPSPKDGGTNNANGELANLSDNHDTYDKRTFTVTNGQVTYSGPHDFSGNKIRLMPYEDTPNNGGVYILAICSLDKGYEAVTPARCKYDAFKIQEGDGEKFSGPTVVKGADGAYDNTYKWTIDKRVDKTIVKQIGGNATFTYTVEVGHDEGTISNVTVKGTITAINPNTRAITGVEISDQLSNGTQCTVEGAAGPLTLEPGNTAFDYKCSLGASLPSGSLSNTVEISWPKQTYDLNAGDDGFTSDPIEFAKNDIDESIEVSDTFAEFMGPKTVSVGGANPTSFTYSKTVSVPASTCVDYNNTATFVTNETGATKSASQKVTVCGPPKTGARTMGFWQGPNGQDIILKSGPTTGPCNGLATYLGGFALFTDNALKSSATCKEIASWVNTTVRSANAGTATMVAMLNAQAMATALDVYFTGQGYVAANSGRHLPKSNIGSMIMDLTYVCKVGGSCWPSVTSAFGGAQSLSVSDMLVFTSANYKIHTRTQQEMAKDAYDSINNEKAFLSKP